MSVYASFIQTPSTVAADLKKRLGTSQTWSGDREEYRIWYVHALSSLFPCSRFFFPLFFPVLEGEDIEKEHCVLDFVKGKVTFEPISSMCWVNGVAVTQATKLNQGMVIS